MPDIWVDVDTAIIVPVNILPLLDDTDFKTIEAAVAYNATGLVLTWNFVTAAGVVTGNAITPTTGGAFDWSEPLADVGMYAIELPASGQAAGTNNDREGVGWFTGVATGVLPWRGPTIGFRRAALNDLFMDGGTASTNLEDFFDGTGYAGGTAKLTVNTVQVNGTSQTAGDIPALVTTVDTVVDAILVDTGTTLETDLDAIIAAVITNAAGVDIAADIIAVKADTAAILTDTGTTLDAALAVVDANVDAILVDTAVIGAAGAGLTAVPWNASWDAEVQSEVDDALVVQRLDELLNADSDIDGLAPPTVGSVVHEMLSKTAGSFTFDQTTDSLEAIRDKETDIETDTAEIGAAGAGLTAINLPDQTMNITGDITGNLSGSVGSVTGAVGSVTGLTASNLDTTVSSRATPAQVNAEVVDALATDTYAEPAQGAAAATTTLAAKINFL